MCQPDGLSHHLQEEGQRHRDEAAAASHDAIGQAKATLEVVTKDDQRGLKGKGAATAKEDAIREIANFQRLGEGAGEEPDESDGSSQGCCGPAADAVSEDAHDGRAEENHAHGQRANPCCFKLQRGVLLVLAQVALQHGVDDPEVSVAGSRCCGRCAASRSRRAVSCPAPPGAARPPLPARLPARPRAAGDPVPEVCGGSYHLS